MSRIYKRSCVAIVDGVRVEGLRMSLTVKKTLKKEPNTCELKIWNLSKDTRGWIKSKGAPVILSAGYEGAASVIFSGDARTVNHLGERPEWVTVVRCGDGERAYQFAEVAHAFGPGTRIADAIRTTAKALGVGLGNLEQALASGAFRGNLTQFAHGYTTHGKAAAELDKLLRTVGLSWSIQNGRLQILGARSTAAGSAVLLSASTGLVGSPEFVIPEKKGSAPVLTFKAMLQPQIQCGGVVAIRSEAFPDGAQFRVETLTHKGDTHGTDWYTEGEGIPI